MLCQVRFKNRCRQLALDDYKVVDTAVDCKSNDADQPYNELSIPPFFIYLHVNTCKTFRLFSLILGYPF